MDREMNLAAQLLEEMGKRKALEAVNMAQADTIDMLKQCAHVLRNQIGELDGLDTVLESAAMLIEWLYSADNRQWLDEHVSPAVQQADVELIEAIRRAAPIIREMVLSWRTRTK